MKLYEKFKQRYLDILSRSYYLSEEVLKNIGNYTLTTNRFELQNTISFLIEIINNIITLERLGVIVQDSDIYLELRHFFVEYEKEYFEKEGYKYDK